MTLDIKKVLTYYDQLPSNDTLKALSEEELEKHIFDAYEDIHSNYPKIKISERMIIKQIEFKVEAENLGVGAMHRLGVKSQKINDASIELSHTGISPYVLELIRVELGHSMGRIGRLV